MKPLIVLISVFLLSNLFIRFTSDQYNVLLAARIAMCAMLCFTAVAHFVFTKGMSMMIPLQIPFKTELIYITGVIEIFLGIGLLIPGLTIYAAWSTIFFLVFLLPANIYAAVKHIDYQKGDFNGNGITYLWFRVPLQLLFIVWIYLSTIKVW
ncbi:hypothetical protein [Flavobacterium sp. MDT1-60]|uniref:DoxX family protein n=1 Tax=Flavobacterium sp. MDT1-60 TaxID=1979344 RepID=UPI0017871853|nr:hypothetical protein [Flavobacterium sp. MDT1-60]QOG00868.1 hypothetical protein IHE43_13695 [Flavobacterium sp. MDT1-60]